MAKKRIAAKVGKPKRNPMARSLKSGLFRQKVVERPDKPKRRPKYPPRPDADEDGE